VGIIKIFYFFHWLNAMLCCSFKNADFKILLMYTRYLYPQQMARPMQAVKLNGFVKAFLAANFIPENIKAQNVYLYAPL
jgi:hypothetical protein